MSKKLSILIPAYNEAPTIHLILDKVLAVNLIGNLTKEIVIVNDCSKDTTQQVVVDYFKNHSDIDSWLFHPKLSIIYYEMKMFKECLLDN